MTILALLFLLILPLPQIMQDYFEERKQLFTLDASLSGDHRYDHILSNYLAEEHRERQRALYRKYLKALAELDRGTLSPRERLSYDIFKRDLETRLAALPFIDAGYDATERLMPVNQFWGLPITFAQLGAGKSLHPFKTVKDYENFLGRIDGFTAWTDSAVADMRKGIAARVVPPRVLMERVLPQLEAMLVSDARQSIFYQPIAEMPASISGPERARLADAYTRAITDKVIPSYRKLYDFIKNEYMPHCRATAGIHDTAGGKERYAFWVRYYTTTNLSPDEIHQMGLAEVARIRTEMERVKESVGFKGDLKAFFNYVRTDARFYPFQSEQEVLNGYRAIESRLQSTLPKYFGLVPKAKFEVRATEAFRAASASEEYSSAAPDGSRPGIFYVPVTDARKYHSIRMESLFLHEALPGHHYQNSLQQEQRDLPEFRRILNYSAYGEGWALYTEGLGRELGLYTDPFQYFGALTQDMHRAIRLVVDTGMHAKGWTREQAIAYSLDNEGLNEKVITSEIERYMAIPGQALSYKIGQLKILELRRRAERALGARFSIRDFHDEILRDGAMPLDILEAKIDEWIKQQAAASAQSNLLILNKTENTLAIVDADKLTVVARVPTGEGPHEAIVSADGKLVYVANYGSAAQAGNSISIIDIAARKEVKRLDLGALLRPHGIVESGGKIYFTAEGSRVVARYDPARDRIDLVMGTGQAVTHMLVVSRDGKKIYTANIGSDTVTVIEQGAGPGGYGVTQIATGKGPEGIDLSPDGNELWVAHRADGGLSIIDTATKKVKETIKVGNFPIRVKFTPDGKRVLVSNAQGGDVVVIDAATRKELKRVQLGGAPVGILITPDGKRAFVAAMEANKVHSINLDTLEVTGSIDPGKGPDGMAWAGK